MRLIQATMIQENVARLTEWLEEEDLDYVLLPEEKDKFSHLLMVPVAENRVEEVLEKLKDLGVEDEGYLTVSEVEAVVSEKLEKQKEETLKETSGQRISRDEIVANVRSLSRSTVNYILFTLLSAVVATSGLLMNSAAVVVGSMVIAPLIGPAMAASVASVTNDSELFKQGVYSQILGVAVAVAGSAIFALFMRFLTAPQLDLILIKQVAERIHPGLTSLAVALAAGVAGALSLTSGASGPLVGVMIAVALIPPAATMGLGIAYLKAAVILSPLILLFVNLLSINLAALLTLWLRGYRPENFYQKKKAQGLTLRRGLLLSVAILTLSLFLGATTIQQRRSGVNLHSVLNQARELGLEPLDYQVEYEMNWLFSRPEAITISIENPEQKRLDELKRYLQKQDYDFELRILNRTVRRLNS